MHGYIIHEQVFLQNIVVIFLVGKLNIFSSPQAYFVFHSPRLSLRGLHLSPVLYAPPINVFVVSSNILVLNAFTYVSLSLNYFLFACMDYIAHEQVLPRARKENL